MPIFGGINKDGGESGVGHPVYGRRRGARISRSAIFYIPDFLGPPQNFRVESRTPTTTHLVWTNPATFVTFIEIERALGDGSFAFVTRLQFNQTAYTYTGLVKESRYRYRMRAV